MRILLVDDDEAIAFALATALESQHYVVDVANDGEKALELVDAFPYDLLLLDVMLPKLDGITLCQQLRGGGFRVPILLLTARDSSTDKVRGLDAGADDYLIKPFDRQELLARIRTLLRRGSSPLLPVLEWNDLRLAPSTCQVTYKNQLLNLTPTEYRLLELFLRNNRRVFSCGDLIEHLWSFDNPPSEETVRSHIKGLRMKLRATGVPADLVETVYGLGYRLKSSSSEKSRGEWERGGVGEIIQSPVPNAQFRSEATLAALAGVWERFKKSVMNQVEILQQCARAAENKTLSDRLLKQATVEAHKLSGLLGTIGFPDGSELSRQIEHLLRNADPQDASSASRFQELVVALNQVLQQPLSQQKLTAVSVANDLTDRKQTEAQLSQYRDRLEELVELRTSELRRANEQLRQEISDRKQAEAELKQQKELLQKIFDHIPVMVALFDINGKIKMVNREWEKVLGWSLLELQNLDTISELYPDPEYRQEVLNFIASASHQWGDFKTRVRSGRILDTSWANVRLSDGSNIGIGQDISDRKRSEAALRESEERFRKIFTQAPIGIALNTIDGQLFQVNKTFCQILGYTESEMKTLNLREISYPADLEKELPYLEQCLKGEMASYQLEKRYIKKSGDLLWTNLIGGVISDPDRDINYGLTMIEDITERKEIERMKDEFISIVSHELRTPLTSLRGALGLLSTGRMGAMNEQGQRLLEFAMEDTDRLVRLVNDILDLERLKLGKMTLSRQICDAADLMRSVVNLMQPLAQKAEVTLSVIADSVKVWADCDRIIQVLTNLVSNAIKFSPPSSTVFLSAHPQENRILFQVKDTGRGIPTEHLQKIFEPFQQVDASDSRQKGGTGLGLTICRSIVAQHEGHLWVESTVELGSTFSFDLPMQP